MNQFIALQTALWDVIVVVALIGGLFGCLLLAWLVICNQPSTLNPRFYSANPKPFEPGQWVKVVRVLEWMYGPSVSVPKGAIIQLIDRFDTSDGPRWSAKWKRVHLHSVPEEFIEPYDWKEGPRAEGRGPRASGSHVGLPVGMWVASCDGNGDGNWKWIVHDPVTGLAIESGTEPTELRAINMAWAAYDRATEADTALDGLFVLLGKNHAIVEARMQQVRAFLFRYFGSGGQWSSCHAPTPTITAKDRLALGTVLIGGSPYQIVDIGMRMLTPRELFAAQGFPSDYEIESGEDGKPLSKSAQVARCGNSVPPAFAAALVRANCPDLCGVA